MNLQEYADSRRKTNPGVDAIERWNTRIVPQGLEKMGAEGAVQYLFVYGSKMAAPKTIALASQADAMGCHEMANRFWQHAAILEKVQISGVGNTAKDAPVTVATSTPPALDPYFPKSLQPGTVAPMQPSDGKQDRQFYISSSNYWGQPKRDGHKWLIFATQDKVYYQSRSTKLKGAPSLAFDRLMRDLAKVSGAFILEGELYWLDAAGGEHKTGPQAVTANIEMDRQGALPRMKFMPFVCLYKDGTDLRDQTYAVRVLYATAIVNDLIALEKAGTVNSMFERCPTARTFIDKRELAETQKAQGREGEIWFDPTRVYESGKFRDDSIVRTKYLETLPYLVTGLTPTTAAGRLFGAIELSDLTGKPVGSAGTGFDGAAQLKIKTMFEGAKAPSPMQVTITHQGFSETGQLIHARLDDERF